MHPICVLYCCDISHPAHFHLTLEKFRPDKENSLNLKRTGMFGMGSGINFNSIQKNGNLVSQTLNSIQWTMI